MTAGAISVPTIVPLRAPKRGQHKTCIDSSTKIELHTETSGATIYYTTNGDKPNPFQTIGGQAKCTYKYREPFRLPAGKRTVKALAVASDGMRESNIVTKTFEVEQSEIEHEEPQDDGLNFVRDLPRNDSIRDEVKKYKLMGSKQAWSEVNKMRDTEEMMRDMSVLGTNERNTGTGPRFMNSRLGNTSSRVTIGQDSARGIMDPYMNGEITPKPRRPPPDTATQALRLQRETDFLKCIYCFAPRPSDPYARFCHDCGNPVPPLPQTRIAPPEPGQMGMCVHCKSMVPFNTPNCVICEAPMQPQNQPQAAVRLHDKLVCNVCHTHNPANLSSCVTCGERLQGNARPIHVSESATPLPKSDGRLLSCTKCGRVNNADARFCDWCGAKPTPPNTTLVCSKCRASNHPYASYCAGCGAVLEPPQRPDVRNSGIAMNMTSDLGKTDSQWMPLSLPYGQNVPKCSQATQTVGLYYPSQKEMEKKHLAEETKLEQERQMRDRNPPLTAISPGRGYWRKQMDHVCAHLKAHAQNNAEFRALMAEPRMGKIISTSVHEDGYELSLTVNFNLRGTKDPFKGKEFNLSRGDLLSSYTEARHSNLRSYGSEDSLVSGRSTTRSTGRRTKKKVVKKVRRRQEESPEKISLETKRLLREVGKDGEGQAAEVTHLLEEGADPKATNKDGVPVLHVAVMNKQVDAIPILVQEGALDINVKGPNRGNTALHEAVGLGPKGMEVIDLLLNLGANPQRKNDRGETPYDLAVKNGYEAIGNRLASSVGQSALDKLTKPKSTMEIY